VALALTQGKSWLKPIFILLHISAMNGGVKARSNIRTGTQAEACGYQNMRETSINKMKIPIQLNY